MAARKPVIWVQTQAVLPAELGGGIITRIAQSPSDDCVVEHDDGPEARIDQIAAQTKAMIDETAASAKIMVDVEAEAAKAALRRRTRT